MTDRRLTRSQRRTLATNSGPARVAKRNALGVLFGQCPGGRGASEQIDSYLLAGEDIEPEIYAAACLELLKSWAAEDHRVAPTSGDIAKRVNAIGRREREAQQTTDHLAEYRAAQASVETPEMARASVEAFRDQPLPDDPAARYRMRRSRLVTLRIAGLVPIPEAEPGDRHFNQMPKMFSGNDDEFDHIDFGGFDGWK